MSSNKWAQITESAEGLKQQLGKLGCRIFSDDYINSHPVWRKRILSDRKGYVHLQDIIQQLPVNDCLLDWHVTDLPTQQLALYYSLAEHCSELLVNYNRVRRLAPYRWNKLTRPILLDRIDDPISLTDVRQYLGDDAFSQHEEFVHQPERNQYIYAPSHRKALQQLQSEFLPFKVVDYFGVCKEKERESRFWEQHEVRRYGRLQYDTNDRSKNWRGAEEQADRRYRNNRNEMQEQRYNHAQADFECTLLLPNPQFNALLPLPPLDAPHTEMCLE